MKLFFGWPGNLIIFGSCGVGRAIVWILKWKWNKMIVVSHDESYIVAVQRNTKCSGWVVDISECLLLAFAPFRSTKPGHPRPHLKAASIKGRKHQKFITMICQSCSEEWKMLTVAFCWLSWYILKLLSKKWQILTLKTAFFLEGGGSENDSLPYPWGICWSCRKQLN